MSDISRNAADLPVVVIGATTAGIPTTPVGSDTNGALLTSHLDIAVSGSILALDSGTTTFSGANGQILYTGTPTTNSSANFTLSSIGNVAIQVGIIGAGGTLVVEISDDGGTSWFRPSVYQPGTQSYSNAFTLPFMGVLNVAGMTNLRVRSTVSWTGTATVTVKETLNNRSMIVAEALPAGTNVIGGVTQSGTWTIAALTNSSIVKAQLQDNSGNAINSDNGQILSQDTIGVSGQYRAQSVTTAAEALGGATILVNRKFISITPTNGIVYWGFNSSVTTANGTPIFKNQTFTLSATDAVHIFVIASTGTVDCRIAEGS